MHFLLVLRFKEQLHLQEYEQDARSSSRFMLAIVIVFGGLSRTIKADLRNERISDLVTRMFC